MNGTVQVCSFKKLPTQTDEANILAIHKGLIRIDKDALHHLVLYLLLLSNLKMKT